MVVVAI